jgi:hypothetical protein
MLGALFIFGTGTSVGMKWAEGRQAVEEKHIQEATEAASTAAAKAISEQKQVFTTIQGKVVHETSTNTIYRDCVVPADGMQLVRQALNGGTVPPSDSKLPPKASPAQ